MATKYKPEYVAVNLPTAPKEYTPSAPYQTYESTAVAPAEYKPTAVAPDAYTPGTYNSKYGDQVSSALNTITNWHYDPLKDASYQALAKVYGARGNLAAKNTLADAASLNGGYGTSYAVSAAQQARNQYNQELAALIPDLEQTAFAKAQTTYNALRDAEETEYGRWRDTESDRLNQWNIAYNMYRDKIGDEKDVYNMAYQRYRDTEGDNQWKYQQGYNAYRDTEADRQWMYSQAYQKYQDALAQYQWALNYNNTLYAQEQAAASSGGGGGGGGGGRRSSRGGGGGSSSGGGSATTGLQYAAAKSVDTVKQGAAAIAKATGKLSSGNTTVTKKKTGGATR